MVLFTLFFAQRVLLVLFHLTLSSLPFCVRFTLYIAISPNFHVKKSSFFDHRRLFELQKKGKKGKKGYLMYFSKKYIVWTVFTPNFVPPSTLGKKL